MRNLLAFLAALVIVVGGLGWYLGWYKFESSPMLGGHKRVGLDIDTNKVKNDVKKGTDVVIEKGKQAVEKITDKNKSSMKKDVEKLDPVKLLGGGQEEETSMPLVLPPQ
jgi:UDP-N-acetyl-D-mannosaminuronate dehydrogenase